jgi:hypothetical protein
VLTFHKVTFILTILLDEEHLLEMFLVFRSPVFNNYLIGVWSSMYNVYLNSHECIYNLYLVLKLCLIMGHLECTWMEPLPVIKKEMISNLVHTTYFSNNLNQVSKTHNAHIIMVCVFLSENESVPGFFYCLFIAALTSNDWTFKRPRHMMKEI